jgi:hypothetical protein
MAAAVERESRTGVGSVGSSGEAVYYAEGLRLRRWRSHHHCHDGDDQGTYCRSQADVENRNCAPLT